MTIDQRICELVAQVSRVSPDQIQPNSDLYRDLGIDSLRTLELVATLETELGVAIPEIELLGLKTPRDIADKIAFFANIPAP